VDHDVDAGPIESSFLKHQMRTLLILDSGMESSGREFNEIRCIMCYRTRYNSYDTAIDVMQKIGQLKLIL